MSAINWEPAVNVAPDEAEGGDDGLGAAVLPEFTDAAGLEQIATQPAAPRSRRRTATEEAAPPALPADLLRQAITQLDKTVSILLEVEAEESEYLEGVADSCLPLANHYAAKSESVVAMAIFAGLGLLSYAVVKYQRFRERIKAAHDNQTEGR